MADMTPAELLRQVRSVGGEAALRNLAPTILAIGMADGCSPDDPDAWYTPSMTIGPMVHPTLAALLDFHGATRRGRAAWQIGHGEETPQGALGALLDSAREGTVWLKGDLMTRRKPRDLLADRTTPALQEWNNKTRHPVVGRYFTRQRLGRHAHQNSYRTQPERMGAARFGLVTLSVEQRSTYIGVHTTQLLELPEELVAEIGPVPLDLWQVGRGLKPAVRVYPAQALAIAEWAASVGLPVSDPTNSGALAKFRDVASTSVVAWPRRGRPAQATVSVGANAPKAVHKAILGKKRGPDGRTSWLADTDSVALAASLEGVADASRLVHPAVLDAAALAAAQPVDDEALREYQREAVGRHVVTNLGYVNVSSPGLGKTIMVLDAMRRRAMGTPGYRALVVAEANVRAQWCQEAELWFPGATVVRVESRSDTARLEQVLAEAGAFPVLVVTSYALAADAYTASDSTIDDEPIEDAGEEELQFDEEGVLIVPPAPEPAPEPEPKPEPKRQPAGKQPAVIDHEPADLLEYLALILAGDDAVAEDEDENDDSTLGLGEVLLSQFWNDLIADEAVTLRSTSSKQSKALWRLRAQSQVAVALTGTPVNRGINDLGALVSWVRNDRRLFRGVSLESQFDLSSDADLADFTAAMGAILFRRDKSEIEGEIPGVDPKVMVLEPTAAERALANAARNELKRAYDELVNWLAEVSSQHEDSPEYAQAKEALSKARHAWLGGTTLARMAASDPAALLTANGAGAALLASQGLIAAATAQTGTKRTAVVTDVIDRVANGERVLIFTEFATVARGLIEDLDASGLRVGQVLGGGGAKRDRHVIEFRNGDLDVLVCTSAGERGLNLQTATTIVHYDLPWTPQGVIQRAGRVERIGATADRIKVVFPVMAGTIEERVVSVVVARAATMMRALDSARGVDVRRSDVGRAFGDLANAARDDQVGKKDAVLLNVTRELLAA